MAWGWLDRNKHEGGEWTGFIEQGVHLEGRLEAEGTFRIDSGFKGTIVSGEMLILGEHALVDGEIIGHVIQIAGRFTGKIQAKSRVSIESNAVVTADIETPCLVVESGGVFDGNCLLPKADQPADQIVIPVKFSSPNPPPAP